MTAPVRPTDVRLAVPADRPEITRLTALLHDENGLLPISTGKVDALLDRYFNHQGAIIGVVGDVGAPVAAIYLGISQLSYSDDWLLVEEFNFVHPDHRGTSYASQLISYAKAVSDQMRLPLMVGILSNKRTEAKARLYERLLDKAGYFFIHNLQFANGPGWGK
jgi:GNAT superfamily N-acetyltransferase